MTLIDLLVTRAYAVQDSDAARLATTHKAHLATIEHLLQIGRGDDVVVDAVAILLLDVGVEKIKSRRHNHSVAPQLLAR